jgi:formate-dependent nitrite reductase membrane component NrfD
MTTPPKKEKTLTVKSAIVFFIAWIASGSGIWLALGRPWISHPNIFVYGLPYSSFMIIVSYGLGAFIGVLCLVFTALSMKRHTTPTKPNQPYRVTGGQKPRGM